MAEPQREGDRGPDPEEKQEELGACDLHTNTEEISTGTPQKSKLQTKFWARVFRNSCANSIQPTDDASSIQTLDSNQSLHFLKQNTTRNEALKMEVRGSPKSDTFIQKLSGRNQIDTTPVLTKIKRELDIDELSIPCSPLVAVDNDEMDYSSLTSLCSSSVTAVQVSPCSDKNSSMPTMELPYTDPNVKRESLLEIMEELPAVVKRSSSSECAYFDCGGRLVLSEATRLAGRERLSSLSQLSEEQKVVMESSCGNLLDDYLGLSPIIKERVYQAGAFLSSDNSELDGTLRKSNFHQPCQPQEEHYTVENDESIDVPTVSSLQTIQSSELEEVVYVLLKNSEETVVLPSDDEFQSSDKPEILITEMKEEASNLNEDPIKNSNSNKKKETPMTPKRKSRFLQFFRNLRDRFRRKKRDVNITKL